MNIIYSLLNSISSLLPHIQEKFFPKYCPICNNKLSKDLFLNTFHCYNSTTFPQEFIQYPKSYDMYFLIDNISLFIASEPNITNFYVLENGSSRVWGQFPLVSSNYLTPTQAIHYIKQNLSTLILF